MISPNHSIRSKLRDLTYDLKKISSFNYAIFLCSVGKMESNQDDISQDLIKSRSDFRRSERSWMAEKETLLRKLQLVQNFALSPSAEADGFFTDKRAAGRVAGDLGVQKKIQRLNVSESRYISRRAILFSTQRLIWCFRIRVF